MNRLSPARRSVVIGTLAALSFCWNVSAQGRSDEAAPALTASAVLDGGERAGPHYKVDEAVDTPGFYHEFTIASDFGTFDAVGRSQLAVRRQEVSALAALLAVSKTEVFVKAMGESLAAVGSGVVNAVTDPVATAKGIGSGVKRLGINLGRRTKRAVDGVTSDEKPAGTESAEPGNAAAGVAKNLLGVTGAMRRWAQKVGADPYTTNPVLRKALEDVAKVDAAGGLATKIVVPIPMVVGTTAKVGDLVWAKDPEELRKLNEERARELGASEVAVNALFASRVFTPTLQTRLIAALHAVKVPGCGDYVASAAEADDEREAVFFTESAELLQTHHAATRVASVLTDSRALVAKMPSGEAVALLPLDWIRATAAAGAELAQMGARAREELGATSLRLHATGRVTERAAQEYAALGWRQ